MLMQSAKNFWFLCLPLVLLFVFSTTGCGAEVDAESFTTEAPEVTPFLSETDAPKLTPVKTEVVHTVEAEATTVPPEATPSLTAVTEVTAAPTPAVQTTPDLEKYQSEAATTASADVEFSFFREYVDTNYGGNGRPGWVRAGDMDQDGDVDIVAGGGYALYIYENDGNADGWTRYGNLDGTSEMGANGSVLFDVDSDGDLDVVSAKYYSQLGWWENPGGSLKNDPWQFHAFSDETWFLHDIIVVDIDEDGVAEEFVTNLNNRYWDTDIMVKWFRIGADATQPWESYTIEKGRGEGAPHGHAGIDAGDIDKDGYKDIAFSNGWYEAPDNLQTGDWIWHQVSSIYGISNALAGDMDGDNDLDMLVSGGHHGQGVFWLENSGNPKSGSWKQHNISEVIGSETSRHYYDVNSPDHLHHPECLALEDMDGDGDRDVITCDLYFGEDPGEPRWNEEKANVYIIENLGSSDSWKKHNIAPNSYPSHLLQMADVNEDGQLDILSESAGYSAVSYYENITYSAVLPTSTPVPTINPTSLPLPTLTRAADTSESSIFVPITASEKPGGERNNEQ